MTKLRGSDFEGGRHALRLTDSVVVVYPRLMPGAHEREFDPEIVRSGVVELDEMLGGGIERGTITMVERPEQEFCFEIPLAGAPEG